MKDRGRSLWDTATPQKQLQLSQHWMITELKQETQRRVDVVHYTPVYIQHKRPRGAGGAERQAPFTVTFSSLAASRHSIPALSFCSSSSVKRDAMPIICANIAAQVGHAKQSIRCFLYMRWDDKGFTGRDRDWCHVPVTKTKQNKTRKSDCRRRHILNIKIKHVFCEEC